MISNVATKKKIYDHEHIFFVLKSEPQIDKKRVLEEFENLQLTKHISNGIFLDTSRLVHVFHCIHSLSVLLLDDAHLKKKE